MLKDQVFIRSFVIIVGPELFYDPNSPNLINAKVAHSLFESQKKLVNIQIKILGVSPFPDVHPIVELQQWLLLIARIHRVYFRDVVTLQKLPDPGNTLDNENSAILRDDLNYGCDAIVCASHTTTYAKSLLRVKGFAKEIENATPDQFCGAVERFTVSPEALDFFSFRQALVTQS